MTSDARVLPRDVVRSGSCIAGSRQWLEAHGLSFREFLRDGLPVDQLRAINCPLANKACEQAEIRIAEELN